MSVWGRGVSLGPFRDHYPMWLLGLIQRVEAALWGFFGECALQSGGFRSPEDVLTGVWQELLAHTLSTTGPGPWVLAPCCSTQDSRNVRPRPIG